MRPSPDFLDGWPSSLPFDHHYSLSIPQVPSARSDIYIEPNHSNIYHAIPDSNFRDNAGSFTLAALPVPEQTSIFFGMSDATGAMSGGTSTLKMVGGSLSEDSCNITLPANDFFFTTSDEITQCNDYSFTQYPNAVKPITISAFIPGGSSSFVLPPSFPTADSFIWKTNISAQTQVVFSMVDSLNRVGGSDKLNVVGSSNDKSCLLDLTSPTRSSATGQLPSTHPSSPSQNQKSNVLPKGAIIGLVLGGIALAVILGTLLWWLRRRQPKKTFKLFRHKVPRQYAPVPNSLLYKPENSNSSASPHLEHAHRPPTPPSRVHIHHHENSSSLPPREGISETGGQLSWVVHRDIYETDEPIELPPQYDDRRAPIPTWYYLHPHNPVSDIRWDNEYLFIYIPTQFYSYFSKGQTFIRL